MNSKERLERIEIFIAGSSITKEYREKLNVYVKEIKKDLELLEKYEKYISQLVEGHNKLQSAEDWGDIADSAFLIRTALEKMGVIEED